MAVVSGKRRGRGEDSIYWDEAKNRYVGVVSLGYSPSGTRVRKKVRGRTKTEVREKLKELHAQVESGVRPRRHYTVNDALDDWLSTGLDGLAPATVTVYRNTICQGAPRGTGHGQADVSDRGSCPEGAGQSGRPAVDPDGADGAQRAGAGDPAR